MENSNNEDLSLYQPKVDTWKYRMLYWPDFISKIGSYVFKASIIFGGTITIINPTITAITIISWPLFKCCLNKDYEEYLQ